MRLLLSADEQAHIGREMHLWIDGAIHDIFKSVAERITCVWELPVLALENIGHSFVD